MEIANFPVKLKEKPEIEPIVIDSPSPYLNGTMSKDDGFFIIRGHATYDIYQFLKDNPNNAFARQGIIKGIKKKLNSASLTWLSRRNLIYRVSGIPKVFGSTYLYSYSEKSIWKEVWELTPKEIQQCIIILLSNPSMVFSQNDLMGMTKVSRYNIQKWIHNFYSRRFKQSFGFPLIKYVRKSGIRSFYCSYAMTDEKFNEQYEKYYKTHVLKQSAMAKIDGNNFEKFCTWVFVEYMKLKGMNLELKKVDREPCDFIATMGIDISDTLTGDRQNSITMVRFVISCKNWRMDRPLSAQYVMGMSGALQSGMAFYYNRKNTKGEKNDISLKRIYQPRSTIGIIFCTRANGGAWNLAGDLGIKIFDLAKILKMYEVVKEKTGQTHLHYENISLKREAYMETEKTKRKEMIDGGLDVRAVQTS